MISAPKKAQFLIKNPQKSQFNQYWFSTNTINILVEEVLAQGKVCAFLSTPSIYFSIKDEEFK